ncbi:hypothetical protein LP414_05085 [Polaromonas sp. P1(28)-13]|nr:hypothetical protein LP414_05085 [Polaromonas sp. P1(28)-13]
MLNSRIRTPALEFSSDLDAGIQIGEDHAAGDVSVLLCRLGIEGRDLGNPVVDLAADEARAAQDEGRHWRTKGPGLDVPVFVEQAVLGLLKLQARGRCFVGRFRDHDCRARRERGTDAGCGL